MLYNKENYRDRTNLFWIYTNIILNNSLDKIKVDNPNVIVVDPTKRLYSAEKEKNFFGL